MKALALTGQTLTGTGKGPAKDKPHEIVGGKTQDKEYLGQNTSNDPAQGKRWTLQKFYFSIPKHKQNTLLQSLCYWRHSSVHSPLTLTDIPLALHLSVPTVSGSESSLVTRTTLLVAMFKSQGKNTYKASAPRDQLKEFRKGQAAYCFNLNKQVGSDTEMVLTTDPVAYE